MAKKPVAPIEVTCPCCHAKLTVDARGVRPDYLKAVEDFRDLFRRECRKANIDYVPIDTSISFDKALMEYLLQRQKRF